MNKMFLFLVFTFGIFFELKPDSSLSFSEHSQSGFAKYETKRTLCFYAFQKSQGSIQNLDYLENGIPEVLFSSLKDFHFIYETNPLIETIVYPFLSKEIQYTFSNSIFLEKKLILNKILKLDMAMLEGARDDCTYTLTGEYEIQSEDKLKTKIQITNRISGKNWILEKETSLRRAFQELGQISMDLKKVLSPEGLSELEIQAEENGIVVLVDDIYYGTTPFKRNDLPPGKHKILLEKDGFEKLEFYVNLEKNKSKTLKVKLKKSFEDVGYLNVNSVPEGAEVYFGNRYLGKTPLEKTEVKVGKNRIRISLENYIDEFRGVEIEKEKTVSLNFQLKEGNTKEFYKKSLQVFQDYTYFDFSLYSLYGSLIFYASYMYSVYRISKDEDKLYAITTWNEFNTFNQIQTLLTNPSNHSPNLRDSFTIGLFYQQIEINKTQKNISWYRSIQNFSVLGTVGMLVSSVVFYNLGISSPAVEFGYLPRTNWDEGQSFFSIRINWD